MKKFDDPAIVPRFHCLTEIGINECRLEGFSTLASRFFNCGLFAVAVTGQDGDANCGNDYSRR